MRPSKSYGSSVDPLVDAPCVVDTDVLTRFIAANALDVLYQLTNTKIGVCPSVCDPIEVDFFFERNDTWPKRQFRPNSDVVRLLKTSDGNPAYAGFGQELRRFRSHLDKEWIAVALNLQDHLLIHTTQDKRTVNKVPHSDEYKPRQLASGSAESMVVAYRRGWHLLTASNAVTIHARHLLPELTVVQMEELVSYAAERQAITHHQLALFNYGYSATTMLSHSFSQTLAR